MQAHPGQIADRVKLTPPNIRTKDLKREPKFMKQVWDIEDRMAKISSHKVKNNEKD